MPPPGAQAAVHWVHRVMAYAFLILLLRLTLRSKVTTPSGGESSAFRIALLWSMAMGLTQIAIAAGMVLLQLPPAWRVGHVLVGSAVWVALVVLLHQARWPEPEQPVMPSRASL